MIKGFESLSLEAYPDGKAADGSTRYSIGYGHSGAKKGDTITREQADALFRSDIAQRELALMADIKQPATTQGQFDALASFAYNVGLAAFAASTLLRHHNRGAYDAAAAEFPRWIHSGGAVDERLKARRITERNIYAVSSPSLEVASAGGAGMALLFFCPYCSRRSDVHFSIVKAGEG